MPINEIQTSKADQPTPKPKSTQMKVRANCSGFCDGFAKDF